jgi:hypothetical protein
VRACVRVRVRACVLCGQELLDPTKQAILLGHTHSNWRTIKEAHFCRREERGADEPQHVEGADDRSVSSARREVLRQLLLQDVANAGDLPEPVPESKSRQPSNTGGGWEQYLGQ